MLRPEMKPPKILNAPPASVEISAGAGPILPECAAAPSLTMASNCDAVVSAA
jgi:hypothetical protein